MVLSARFAVLACLCAALPLVRPPSVEAAHLHGSHSSLHSHYRAPSASRAGTHNRDGKHQGDKAPHQRAAELPPLLRRHTFQDYKKAENHRDHAQPKVPRSAFARSRYRRASGPHSRPSSIYVPGEHGDTYLVSRTPPRNWGSAGTGTGRQSSHTYNRRQLDESNLALGRIDIMGVAQSLGSTQRLASLTVDSTPIDWTSGQSSAKAFPLNASMTNQTQFIMMPMDETSNAASAGTFNKLVTLATEVFDANDAEMVMYCATYDPDPGSTSALLMTPCTGETRSAAAANDATDPCSDAANDASSNPHQSQIFSYDPSSGRIEPISTTASSRVADTSDDSAASGCAGARIRRDNSNSTTSSSTTPSSTSTSTRPTTTASQQSQNVTLVYVAGALEVPASSPSASTTNASGGQVPLFTTTITTTVVTTVTPTGSSSRTATFPQAAVSVPVSSTPSPSMTNKTPSVSATASRSPSSPSLSSSASATATPKAPASADESLEVEIVGVTPSTTSSSSSTSSTSATTTTTTSYSTMSPSLDAQAAASSLANAMVHPRGRAFVSAAGIVTPP
ncbi:hypothetical protein EV363DRAFT_1391892 [Boletus edulis]|nr:hypothetical protein EV363DRAFT_1391892 [Boletus edulis]